MENDELRAQLADVERAEAAPYTDYPPSPGWYPPLVGGWTAALIGAFWWLDTTVLFVGSVIVLLVGEFSFLAWMERRHGALPRPGVGTQPPEIASVYRRYFLGLAWVALVIALAWWLAGVPAAAGTAFVLVTAGLWVYERAYARAAAATRARLT